MRAARFYTFLALCLALALLGAQPVLAGGEDEAEDVASRRGNPSPSQSESRVNDYTFQDEQINIDGGQDSIVKVLRVDQKNLVNDYVVGVFPINNAHPKEIRSLFRLITAKEGGRAEVIRDKVGNEAFLQVICPRFQLPYIEEALKALDESWVKEDVDGSKQVYYRAKFRPVGNIDRIAEVPGGGDGDATEVDATANAIFKRGEPYRMQSWLSTAEMVDVFPPQMLIDVSVYEVELTNDVKMGLDYVAWKCGPGRDLFNLVVWGFDTTQKATNVTSIFDPIIPERTLVSGTERFSTDGRGRYCAANYVLSSEYIDFMVRNGRARLVTSGRLNVRHGTEGELTVADDVIHFEEGESYYEGYGRCLTHDGELTVGLDLAVTPYIGLETSELEYSVFMSDIVGTTSDGTPMVRSNFCGGTALVRDGVPICLGGVKRTEDVKSTSKFPILGDIPVLGWLFGGEQNADHQTEMVIVLEPQVVQYSVVHKELARAEDKVVRAQVAGQAKLPMLKTEYGFDMWLLGGE